jgi:hypothetical protein
VAKAAAGANSNQLMQPFYSQICFSPDLCTSQLGGNLFAAVAAGASDNQAVQHFSLVRIADVSDLIVAPGSSVGELFLTEVVMKQKQVHFSTSLSADTKAHKWVFKRVCRLRSAVGRLLSYVFTPVGVWHLSAAPTSAAPEALKQCFFSAASSTHR